MLPERCLSNLCVNENEELRVPQLPFGSWLRGWGFARFCGFPCLINTCRLFGSPCFNILLTLIRVTLLMPFVLGID